MKVTSGTCASNLYHDISDVETCKRAVLLFERNKECAVVKGSRRRCVEGCTYEATRQTGLGGKISGVGRKTANVVLGHAFDTPGITVDTHFGRLSRRFGWTKETDPVKVEMIVQQLIPQPEWTNLSQRMIWHGRRICHARKPACGACPVAKICPSVGIGEMDKGKALLLVKTDKDFR